MGSTATLVAGRLARCVTDCIFGTAGTIIGAMVGVLAGFVNEDGLLQGMLIGAISGAFVAVELVESLAKICCSQGHSTTSRVRAMVLVFRNLLVNHLVRASVFPTLSRALDSQMNAGGLPPVQGSSVDIFGASYPVMGMRRAAVEDLPMMKFAEATKEHTDICPICLHDFNVGESGRRLPACFHVFHLVCIDSWLLWHAQCPMCRRAVY